MTGRKPTRNDGPLSPAFANSMLSDTCSAVIAASQVPVVHSKVLSSFIRGTILAPRKPRDCSFRGLGAQRFATRIDDCRRHSSSSWPTVTPNAASNAFCWRANSSPFVGKRIRSWNGSFSTSTNRAIA